MKVKHVFGGHIYLISSFGVARNPLFKEDSDIKFFKENIYKYLGEICEIFAYAHEYNQFQYLVKIKERQILEDFFVKKQSAKVKNVSHDLYGNRSLTIPESYLIFSQEVSNCLNSYAKKFNFKYKRKGGLFGDRYCKRLVENEEEMEGWIQKLGEMQKVVTFSAEWQVNDKADFENKNGECSSKKYYESYSESTKRCDFNNFTKWVSKYMRGCFECLPPASIKAPDFHEKFLFFKKIKGIAPPW